MKKIVTFLDFNLLFCSFMMDMMTLCTIITSLIIFNDDFESIWMFVIIVVPAIIILHIVLKLYRGYIRIVLSKDRCEIKSILFWKTLKCIKRSEINYVYIIINPRIGAVTLEPYLIFSEKEIKTKTIKETRLPIMYGNTKNYIPMRVSKRNYKDLQFFLKSLGIHFFESEYKDFLKSVLSHGLVIYNENECWKQSNLIDHSLIIDKNTKLHC